MERQERALLLANGNLARPDLFCSGQEPWEPCEANLGNPGKRKRSRKELGCSKRPTVLNQRSTGYLAFIWPAAFLQDRFLHTTFFLL